MPRVTGRIVLVGLPADAAALTEQGLADAGIADVVELAPQEAIADLVRDAEDVGAVVTWDPGAGGGIAFAQRIARIDRDLAVLIVAPPERAEAGSRALQFAPFLGDDVTARSTDDLEGLAAEIAEAAARTRDRRARVRPARAHPDSTLAGTRPDPAEWMPGYAEHVLRHAPVGIATLDAGGVVRALNPEAARMLAVDRETAIGRRFADVVPAEHRTAAGGLIASHEQEPDDRLVLEFNGERRAYFVELSASRYVGPGDDLETVVILGDVTARELAAMRLRHVQAVADVALGNLDLEHLLDELLTRIREALAVDTAAVMLVDESGDALRVRAHQGLNPALGDVRVPVGEGFSGRIAQTREPRRVSRVEAHHVVPAAFGVSPEALLGVPLLVAGDLIGVLHVGSATQREWDADDQALLQLVGDRVALAINQARLYAHEQETAEVLQRSLLPQRLPDVPGLNVAARYNPGGAGMEVGGDWYDVTPLGGGQVAVSIGDVIGRGLRAAAVMGHLRAALRAYAVEGHSPGEALKRLNDLIIHGGGNMATAAQMTWDPSGSLRVASAGHPPPLLLGPDGDARLIDEVGGAALGVMPFTSYEETSVELPPGARVVLYTDGLVERRGDSLDRSFERLIEAARNAPPGADSLAERLLERLLGGKTDDDAALLVLEAPPRGARLELELPVAPESLGVARTHLRRWLLEHGAEHDTVEAIVVASGEAASNVIEHAYGPGSATFRLEAERDDGDAVVTVRDSGRWREERNGHHGRGTPLMKALMDDVAIDTGDAGTAVRLRRRLVADG
jgi:PAS domain S-box-containing protein